MGKLINTVGQRGQPFFVCFDERKLKDEKSNNVVFVWERDNRFEIILFGSYLGMWLCDIEWWDIGKKEKYFWGMWKIWVKRVEPKIHSCFGI